MSISSFFKDLGRQIKTNLKHGMKYIAPVLISALTGGWGGALLNGLGLGSVSNLLGTVGSKVLGGLGLGGLLGNGANAAKAIGDASNAAGAAGSAAGAAEAMKTVGDIGNAVQSGIETISSLPGVDVIKTMASSLGAEPLVDMAGNAASTLASTAGNIADFASSAATGAGIAADAARAARAAGSAPVLSSSTSAGNSGVNGVKGLDKVTNSTVGNNLTVPDSRNPVLKAVDNLGKLMFKNTAVQGINKMVNGEQPDPYDNMDALQGKLMEYSGNALDILNGDDFNNAASIGSLNGSSINRPTGSPVNLLNGLNNNRRNFRTNYQKDATAQKLEAMGYGRRYNNQGRGGY